MGYGAEVLLDHQAGLDMLSAARARGFSLIELVVTLSVFGVLLMTAVPALGSWVAGAQVRTVADGIQNGLRLAQVEAARRNRRVQFVLTDSDPLGSGPWTPSSTGRNWVILTVPVTTMIDPETGVAEVAQRVQGATLANVAAGVSLQGPATLSFNAFGGLIRWVYAPGEEVGLLGSAATAGEISLSAFTGGTPGLVGSHMIIEPF